MSRLEGYLQIGDANSCVEIVHNCRTLEFLRNSHVGFKPRELECEDCCCEGIDPVTYTTPSDPDNPAQWYDDTNPGSGEFLGLWGDLNIAQPLPEDVIVPPKTLTFTGLLLSTTKRGKVFGMSWLDQVLSPLCVSCSGRQATVYSFCNDCHEETPTDEIPIEQPDDDIPTLDLSALFDDRGCEIPGADNPLPPVDLETLVNLDDGQRDLLRVQYVAGSLQELEQDFPDCFGCRVTFQFTLPETESFLGGEPICEISPADLGDMDVPCRAACVVNTGDIVGDCGACGLPCQCETPGEATTIDTATANTLDDNAAACRYSAPLACRRYACLTNPTAYDQAAPVITLFAGSQDLVNVSVTVMQAVTGLPNPMTELGTEIYNTRPIESQAFITRVPAGSTLTLDGRGEELTLNCPGVGVQSASPLICGPGGRKYRAPRLCCGLRYWVILDVEAGCNTNSHDDWKLSGTVHGVERT